MNRRSGRGFTLWFTGLPGAGKSTLASCVAEELKVLHLPVEVLDSDYIRPYLPMGLGFAKEERDANVRRIAFVCNLLSRNGVVAIAAVISPYRSVRDEVRAALGDRRFVEVYVNCPLPVLIHRDVKGLYRQALDGKIPNFTGISDPYEPPECPEIIVHTHEETVETSTRRILAWLEREGYIGPCPPPHSDGNHCLGYSEQEEAVVLDRLRDLGYI